MNFWANNFVPKAQLPCVDGSWLRLLLGRECRKYEENLPTLQNFKITNLEFRA